MTRSADPFHVKHRILLVRQERGRVVRQLASCTEVAQGQRLDQLLRDATIVPLLNAAWPDLEARKAVISRDQGIVRNHSTRSPASPIAGGQVSGVVREITSCAQRPFHVKRFASDA